MKYERSLFGQIQAPAPEALFRPHTRFYMRPSLADIDPEGDLAERERDAELARADAEALASVAGDSGWEIVQGRSAWTTRDEAEADAQGYYDELVRDCYEGGAPSENAAARAALRVDPRRRLIEWVVPTTGSGPEYVLWRREICVRTRAPSERVYRAITAEGA